jgi:hypothetical protein
MPMMRWSVHWPTRDADRAEELMKGHLLDLLSLLDLCEEPRPPQSLKEALSPMILRHDR